MSSQRIEKILAKYFEGETSLSEERTLREFFFQDEVPAHLSELKEQFELYERESREELPDDFDEVLFNTIEKRERSHKAFRRTYFYYITGVAATILILITIYVRFDPFTNNNTTYNEEEANIAFTEASRILYFVSDKFNKGTNPLGKVARFDEGMDNMSSVKKFDDGVEKASPISRFNQITNLITNPAP